MPAPASAPRIMTPTPIASPRMSFQPLGWCLGAGSGTGFGVVSLCTVSPFHKPYSRLRQVSECSLQPRVLRLNLLQDEDVGGGVTVVPSQASRSRRYSSRARREG